MSDTDTTLAEVRRLLMGEVSGYQERIRDLEAELDEQARLHGMGSEREAKQLTRIRELELLVEAAYREGFVDGYDDDARARHVGRAWRHSESKKALETPPACPACSLPEPPPKRYLVG